MPSCHVSDSQRVRINSSQEGDAFIFVTNLQNKLIVDPFSFDPETNEAIMRENTWCLKSKKNNNEHTLSQTPECKN